MPHHIRGSPELRHSSFFEGDEMISEKRTVWRMLFAGVPVNCKFMYPGTVKNFSGFVIGQAEGPPDVEICKEDFDIWEPSYIETIGHADAEYRIMVLNISRYLLPFRRCVCHAAAVRWKGLVWLFSAPSGVGKTTLYRNWKECFGDQAEILSGDMPFVECGEDGSVRIHASPWNGKENYHGEGSGKLGGILLLKQGTENRMLRMTVGEAVLPVFRMFLVSLVSTDIVRQTADMTAHILKHVPVWSFENTGDIASGMYSGHILEEYMEAQT